MSFMLCASGGVWFVTARPRPAGLVVPSEMAQESRAFARPWVLEDLARRALLDDPPAVEHDDAVGDPAAKSISWVTTSMVMPSSASRFITAQHLADRLGVERGSRLVEQHEGRAHCERPGDRDTLLLAARQLRRILSTMCRRGPPWRAARAASASASARGLRAPSSARSRHWRAQSRWGNSSKFWKTMPMRRRTLRTSRSVAADQPALEDDLAGSGSLRAHWRSEAASTCPSRSDRSGTRPRRDARRARRRPAP